MLARTKKLVKKIPRQFVYPSAQKHKKLQTLMNNADGKWPDSEELKDILNATITVKFTKFKKFVAMGLKHYNGKIIIHLINLAT